MYFSLRLNGVFFTILLWPEMIMKTPISETRTSDVCCKLQARRKTRGGRRPKSNPVFSIIGEGKEECNRNTEGRALRKHYSMLSLRYGSRIGLDEASCAGRRSSPVNVPRALRVSSAEAPSALQHSPEMIATCGEYQCRVGGAVLKV